MNHRDQLDLYLKQIEKRLRLSVALRGAAILTSVALAATVVLVLIANAFAFSHGSVSGARIALFLALAAAVGLGLALPLYFLDRRRAARKAETAFPQFQQRLLTYAERDRREPFIELLAADTLELTREARPARLAPSGKLALLLAAAGACLGVLVWAIVAGPGYLGYGAHRLWAGTSRGTAAFYDIRVSPGDAVVRRNSGQRITAELMGFASPEARLYARFRSASKWEEARMQPRPEASGFQFVFAGIPEDIEYYVKAGLVESRHFKIRVVDLPHVKQIRVTYHYPSWTGMRDSVEEHGGDLAAVTGTEAELSILTDRPMQGGVLTLGDGRKVRLTGGAGNVYQGAIRIEKDGLYHVAALDGGQPVRLSDDYLIEAKKANPPEVSVTRPGGDYRASPIEEVTVAVKAADDYALDDVSLHYSVNGGAEHTVDLLAHKGAKQVNGLTVLSLENFKLVPGDIVSVYAKAKDGDAESRTDMLFIQAEPFEREYSQSQLAGGGGGNMGSEEFEISEREKEIISATWKQAGDKSAGDQKAAEASQFLSGVQNKLQGQARALAGRLQSRGLAEANDAFSAFQKEMSEAAQAMGPATTKLKQQKWSEAIPSEQKALEHLLRAEATFRRIQVAFGNQGGGGGAGAGRDLANLYNLELDTEKNQYETGQTAESASQRAQEIDKALQKLDELARREQELARQQTPNNNQSIEERWQQEMLRREAEKLQQQMEQLAQNGGRAGSRQASSNQGQTGRMGRTGQAGSSTSGSQAGDGRSEATVQERIQRALDELRQANAAMRRAASQGASAADARRAADRLQEATRQLSGIQEKQGAGQLDSIAREADRLAAQQHDQAARIRQMFGTKGQTGFTSPFRFGDGTDEQSKLADERQLLAANLSRLEKAMQDAARQLAPAQPDAASKLHQALGEMDQANLASRLQRSGQALRWGIDPGSDVMEPAITAGMDRLSQRVREAEQSLKASEQNPTEEALNRVERLRNEIEALTRNSSNRTGGETSNQAQRGQQAEHGQQNQNGQQGQSGEQGQNGQQGGQAQANTGSQGSQSRGADGGFQPGGPRTWSRRGGMGTFIERPGGDGSAGSSSPDQLALQEALRELDGLRRELRSEPESLASVEQVMRDLQRLGPKSFGTKPGLVEQVGAQALAGVDKLELELRRQAGNQQSGQVRNGDSLRVPPGYQESVAEYYRRLSKNR